MKAIKSQPKPISIPPELAARCDGPDQAERMDKLLRAVIAVPKSVIAAKEAKWKAAHQKNRRK